MQNQHPPCPVQYQNSALVSKFKSLFLGLFLLLWSAQAMAQTCPCSCSSTRNFITFDSGTGALCPGQVITPTTFTGFNVTTTGGQLVAYPSNGDDAGGTLTLGDPDLGAPNNMFGGTGVSNDGTLSNNPANYPPEYGGTLGRVLIVESTPANNGVYDCNMDGTFDEITPNDDGNGATMIITFDDCVTWEGIGLLDDAEVTISAFDQAVGGIAIATQMVTVVGDNGYLNFTGFVGPGWTGVRRIELVFEGSGGLAHFLIQEQEPASGVTCSDPGNLNTMACQTQNAVNTTFNTWLEGFMPLGGCNATGSFMGGTPTAPDACGGSVSVTYNVVDECMQSTSCSATFTVPNAPSVTCTPPSDAMEAACQTQTAIDMAFAAWLADFSAVGGCNAVGSVQGNPSAPNACGGTIEVTYNVTDDCMQSTSCAATFTVLEPTPVTCTPPTNAMEAACQTQIAIDMAFAAWLGDFAAGGGCSATGSVLGNPSAPDACGGAIEVTYNVTDDCMQSSSCSATFTVLEPPIVTCTPPSDPMEAACQTQTAIDMAFTNWLGDFAAGGGCSATGSIQGNPSAPSNCGGATTVTYNVTDDCAQSTSCMATFTVLPAPPITISCPGNVDELSCQTQDEIDAKFADWIALFEGDGGCDATGMFTTTPTPPDACGGTTMVIWTVDDTGPGSECTDPMTCMRTFTVATRPPYVPGTCPDDDQISACMIQSLITSAASDWAMLFTPASGGCAPTTSCMVNGQVAPDLVTAVQAAVADAACSDIDVEVTVVCVFDDLCSNPTNCTGTFTVTAAPPLVAPICPTDDMIDGCATQTEINTAASTWADGFGTAIGGCNPRTDYSVNGAGRFTTLQLEAAILAAVAGSSCSMADLEVLVECTVTDVCENPTPCQATFTITGIPPVTCTPPANAEEAACQTQDEIDATFALWLTGFSPGGGCNAMGTPDITDAPDACGGSVEVTYNITDDCMQMTSCSATFTVLEPPVLTCTPPANAEEAACQTQDEIDAAFALWLTGFSPGGGCNATGTPDITDAPDACGGSVEVTYNITDDCMQTTSCSATFTVLEPTELTCTPPANAEEAACQTQDEIDAAFALWLTGFSPGGGCNAMGTPDITDAPDACGGSVEVTYNITDDCMQTTSCSATFTVLEPPELTCTPPANAEEVACQTQDEIDAAFALWLTGFSPGGGCNAMGTPDITDAPDACGGSVEVTYNITDDCMQTTSCSATFTVLEPTELTCTPPANAEEAACQTQDEIDAAFALWLTGFSPGGGCNATGTPDITDAPDACGGSVEVTYSISGDCMQMTSCSATFTVLEPTELTCTPPANAEEAACQTQDEIDAAFALWLTGFSPGGGCNATGTPDITDAPDACGGSVEVTYNITDDCMQTTSCSATFTVLEPTELTCTPPANAEEVACQTQDEIDAAFALWLTGFSPGGGCNAMGTPDITDAPDACGGSVEVSYNITDDCMQTTSCSATFTVLEPTELTCTPPANAEEAACQTQDEIDAAFALWLTGFSPGGGCNAMGTPDITEAPDACGGSVEVTYSISGDCMQMTSCSATFTVLEPAPITMFCPEDVSEIACQTQDQIDQKFDDWIDLFTGGGGCDATGTFDPSSPAAPSACGGMTTVSWTVDDQSDCTDPMTCTKTFTVEGPPAVSLICPNDTTVASCLTEGELAAEFAAWLDKFSASGGCDGVAGFEGDPGPPSNCGGQTTVTYSIDEECTDAESCTRTFTVETATPVDLDCPDPVSEAICDYTDQAALTAAYDAWLAGFVVNNDGCNAIATLSPAPPVSLDYCTVSEAGVNLSVTHTIDDGCSEDECISTFVITPSTPVTVSCPDEDVSMSGCLSQEDIDAAFAAWIADFTIDAEGCGITNSTNLDDYTAPPACALSDATVVIPFFATDGCTRDECEGSFTVAATAAPSISCNGLSTTAECSDDVSPSTPAFISVCPAELSTTGPIIVGDLDCPGTTYTYTHTVTDDCGRTASCNQVITLANDDPIIDCSAAANLILECDGEYDAEIASWLATSSAALQATLEASCSEELMISNNYNGQAPELSCDLSEGIVVIFSAADACGRTVSCSKTIYLDDSVNPFWTSPLPQNLVADCAMSVDEIPWPELTAEDACAGELVVNRSSQNGFASCGGGTVIRTYTVSDVCGNTITTSYQITFTDVIPPVLTVPADTTVACGATAPSDSITVTDNCSRVEVTMTEVRKDINACEYEILRTWEAIDGCGNVSSATQKISFADQEAPIISLVPEMAALVNDDGDMVLYGCDIPRMPIEAAIVTDDCCVDPASLVSFDRLVAKNVCGVFGFHTRYRCGYKYTDAAGHSTVLAFDVFQYDTTAPVIQNLPPDLALSCNAIITPADTMAVFATDECGRTIEGSFTQNTILNPADPAQAAVMRTWSFADDCGNRSSGTQTITLCDFNASTDIYSKLGNTVWLDENKNGIQDTGEEGMDNVLVYLYLDHAQGGARFLMDSTLSYSQDGVEGQYGFEFLLDAEYALEFVAPEGYHFTKANASDNDLDQRDSDADAETGMVFGVRIRNGSVINDIDVGLVKDTDSEEEEHEDEEEEEADESITEGDGIHQQQDNDVRTELSVFPNPTSDRVEVRFNSDLDGDVNLFLRDNYGKAISQRVVEATRGHNRVQMDLSAYPAGIYLIQLVQNGGQKMKRVIKN